MPRSLPFALAAIFACTLIAASPGSTPANAAAFTVTKTADTNDGACDTDCSLREAVIAANNNPGPDVITLPAGTYELTIPGRNEELAATGDLDIHHGVTIVGAGAAETVINANQTDRIFDIFPFIAPAARPQGNGNGDGIRLEGIALTGGDNDLGGGAIDAAPDTGMVVHLLDVIAEGNHAFNGGAIGNFGIMEMEDSVIRNNTAASGPFGGGIFNGGTLTITNSTISGNSSDLDGGGIFNIDGTLVLQDSSVNVNSALQDGGGIYNLTGQVTVNNSTIAGNTADGTGGGIYNLEGTLLLDGTVVGGNDGGFRAGGIGTRLGETTIQNSTITANSAVFGGGLHVHDGATVNVLNSTISNNIALNSGGGINAFVEFQGQPGTLNITHSTITNNTTDADQDGGGNGGGIANEGAQPSTVTIAGTIIGDNMDLGGESPDVQGPLTSAGYNIIENGAGATVTGDNTGNMIGVDPGLMPLADNGGPTLTHALAPDSPALDAAGPACPPPATDQRGITRPQGPACDIGAFEREVATPTPSPSPTPAGQPVIWGALLCGADVGSTDALAVLVVLANLAPLPHPDCPAISDDVTVQQANAQVGPLSAEAQKWGDVNCSGAADSIDALQILLFVAHLPVPAPPVGCPAIGDQVTLLTDN